VGEEAIIHFQLQSPLEGYRRLTLMMLDADGVAVSAVSVWRVLQQAGLLSRWNRKPPRKGTGFEQPPQPHQHSFHLATEPVPFVDKDQPASHNIDSRLAARIRTLVPLSP
jgi:hypothetical protein